MKRTIGTFVLFVLLILTIAALTQLRTHQTSALKPNTSTNYEVN